MKSETVTVELVAYVTCRLLFELETVTSRRVLAAATLMGHSITAMV